MCDTRGVIKSFRHKGLQEFFLNGPWCITFEWQRGDACQVEFEQYH